jgi:hypothetical protein
MVQTRGALLLRMQPALLQKLLIGPLSSGTWLQLWMQVLQLMLLWLLLLLLLLPLAWV